MEEYGGADDDFFYDDLKRRILSLMMDEEEEEGNRFEEERRSPSSIDGLSKEISKYGSSCSSPNVHGVPLLITEDPKMLNVHLVIWVVESQGQLWNRGFHPSFSKA
ncbi:hypothetical protein ACLOJK_038335 [Asimina triloba]